MLVCSCAVITDHDIEAALIEIMSAQNAPLPTPGVVWRHLSKKMNCSGCAPFAVETIYEKLEMLERKGLICPYACVTAKTRMRKSGMADGCGVAPVVGSMIVVSSGLGELTFETPGQAPAPARHCPGVAFDNHLILATVAGA